MDARHEDGGGDPHRSLIFLVSDPLVRVWGWVFLVGLGGIVTAAFGLVGSLTAIFGLASMESEGVHVLWLVFAVGSAAFSDPSGGSARANPCDSITPIVARCTWDRGRGLDCSPP